MLTSQLQTDLRELSVEARKKYPHIKESAERAILKLRSLSEQFKETSQQLQELTRSINEVLRPFLLACETKQNKLLNIALSGIHKLVTHGALSPTSVPTIVRTISAQIHVILSEENAQLKVLQLIVALLGTRSFSLHGDDLSQALGMCLRLLNHAHSKGPSCSLLQPVTASLKQILGTLLDRVHTLALSHKSSSSLSGDQREALSTEFASSLMDVHKLLKDLCHLTGGEPAIWISVESIPRTFGLELLEEALTHHAALFRSVSELQTLLKDKLCKVLLKYFRVTEEFTYLMRLLRLVTTFVVHFYDLFVEETEALLLRLSTLFDTAAEVHNEWVQSLILEVLLQFNQIPTLLCGLYRQYDSREGGSKIFEKMITILNKVVQRMSDWDEDEFVFRNSPANVSSLGKLRSVLTDTTWLNRNETTPPPITRSYLVSLCTNSIHTLIDSIALIISNMYKTLPHSTHSSPSSSLNITFSPLSTTNPTVLSNNEEEYPVLDTDDFKMCQALVQTVWTCVFPSLSLMLVKSKDEAVVQNILKAYQSFTNSCCILRLTTPREALLTSLCKQALPSSNNKKTSSLRADERSLLSLEFTNFSRLTKKHVQTMKTLLNIAHCMGSILDESWYIVLETLEQLHIFLSFNKKTLSTSTSFLSGKNTSDEVQSRLETAESDDENWLLIEEVNILRSALKSLFATSQYISRSGIVTLLKQLSRLSTQSTLRLSDETSESDVSKLSLFGLTKMSEVILCNSHRVELLWPIFHSHVSELVQHRNSHLRVCAVKVLVSTIQEVIVRLLRGQSSGSMSEGNAEDKNEEDLIRNSTLSSFHSSSPPHSLFVWRVISQLVNSLPPLAQSPHVAVRMALAEAVLTLLKTSGGLLHVASGLSTPPFQEFTLNQPTQRANFVKHLLRHSTNSEKFVDMLLNSLSNFEIPINSTDPSSATSSNLTTTTTNNNNNNNNNTKVGLDNKETDADSGVIVVLNSEVWTALLRVVQVPAQTRDSEVVLVTFKALSLICTEYLLFLPIDVLPFLIATIGLYVEGSVDTQSALMLTTIPQQLLQHQQNLASFHSSRRNKDTSIALEKSVDSLGPTPSKTFDINVSFPAIGLLWNIADYLAKDLHRNLSSLPVAVSLLSGHVLWMILLHEIVRHVSSSHSDIRTCALHTLYGIIAIHAGSMPRFHRLSTLVSLLQLLLFPMMNTIISLAKHAHLSSSEALSSVSSLTSNSLSSSSSNLTTTTTNTNTNTNTTSTASSSPAISSSTAASDSILTLQTTPLSSTPSSAPPLMMHHSRNTVAKQWHETLVIALSGLVRIFKTHFDLLIEFTHADFTWVWKMLLMYIDHFAHSEATEVVLAALTALREVLLTRASRSCVQFSSEFANSLATSAHSNYYPAALWISAWNLFTRILYRTLRNRKGVAKILHVYHESLKELYSKLHSQFTPVDVHRYLTLTAAVPLVALHTDTELTAIHRHTIDLIERVVCDIYKRILVQLPKDNITVSLAPTHHLQNVAHAAALLLHYVAAAIGYPYRAQCDTITRTSGNENIPSLLQRLDSVFDVDAAESEFTSDPVDLRDFLTPFVTPSLSVRTAQASTQSTDPSLLSVENTAERETHSEEDRGREVTLSTSGSTSLHVQHVARLTVEFDDTASPLSYAAHKTWNPHIEHTLVKWFPLAERAIKALHRLWDLFMFGHVYVKREGETDPVPDTSSLTQPTITSLECLSVVTWIFPDVCLVLGRALQMKSIHYTHEIWQLALNTFTHVVRTGLFHTLFRAKESIKVNSSPSPLEVENTNILSQSQSPPPHPSATSFKDSYLLPSVNVMDIALILTDIADSIEAFLFEDNPHSTTPSRGMSSSPLLLSSSSQTTTLSMTLSSAPSAQLNHVSDSGSVLSQRVPAPRQSLFNNDITRDSEFEIQLVSLIPDPLLPATHYLYASNETLPLSSPPALLISSQQHHMLIMRLLMLLFDGSNQQQVIIDQNREQFVCVCYRHLFTLLESFPSTSTPTTSFSSDTLSSQTSSDSVSPSRVPSLVLPPIQPQSMLWMTRVVLRELMKRCKEVLRQFVLDDRQMGNLPLPRARLVEVHFLLTQLKNLQLRDAHLLWETPSKINLSPSRRHLWELYPEFCDCITVREPEIKETLKEIFHLTAKELGLE